MLPPFYLNDPELLKADLTELGFTEIKYWYVAQNFPPLTEDFAEEDFLKNPNSPYFKQEIKEPELSLIIADLRKAFTENFGP